MSPNKDPFNSKEWYDINCYFQTYRVKVKSDSEALRRKNVPIHICFLQPEYYENFFSIVESDLFGYQEILLGLELVSRYIINEYILQQNSGTPFEIKGDTFFTMVICLLIATKFLNRRTKIVNTHVKMFMESLGKNVSLIEIKSLEAHIFKKLDFYVDIPMIHIHCQGLFEFIGGTNFGIKSKEFCLDCLLLVKVYYCNIDKILECQLMKCWDKEIISAGILCTIFYKYDYRYLVDACTKVENAISTTKENFLDITILLIRIITGDESVGMDDMFA